MMSLSFNVKQCVCASVPKKPYQALQQVSHGVREVMRDSNFFTGLLFFFLHNELFASGLGRVSLSTLA